MGEAGPQRLFISPDGDLISLDGRELFRASVDTARIREAVRLLPKVHPLLILLPSPLHFPELSALRSVLQPDDALVPCEADPLLMQLTQDRLGALRESLPSRQLEPLRVLPAGAGDGVLEAVAGQILSHRDPAPRRVAVLRLGRAYRLHAGLYRRMEDALVSAVQRHWQNRATLSSVGPLLRRNVPLNLARARHLAPFAGRPAPVAGTGGNRRTAVLGAGPSLDRLDQHLAVLQRADRILVADSAWLALADTPLAARAELVITEPRLANIADFHRPFASGASAQAAATPGSAQRMAQPGAAALREWDEGAAGRPPRAWMEISGHPSGLRQAARKVGVYHSGIQGSAWSARISDAFPELSGPPTRGSVGVSALEIALLDGAAEVLVLGLDFLSLPGRSHARGSSPHRNMLFRHHRRSPSAAGPVYGRSWIRTEGPWPRQVLSSPVLDDYARSARQLIWESAASVLDLRGFGRSLTGHGQHRAADLERMHAHPSGADPEAAEIPEARALDLPRWRDRVGRWLRSEIGLLERFVGEPGDPGLQRDLDHLGWGLAQDSPGTRRLVAIRELRRLSSILLGLEDREER